MKKLLTLLLCGSIALTFTACKKEDTFTPVTASSSSKGTPYKEPTTANNGANAAIGGENAAANTTSSSRFNFISTSEVENDYELEDDLGGVNILRYIGDGGKVTVPSVIGGKTVRQISDNAFRGSEVTNVVIPSSVDTIENHAFSGCDKLESLTISEGVKVIDDYAFADCPKLALVSLPDSLMEIGVGAFRNCSSLLLTYKGKTYTIANVEELYDIF